MSDTTELEQHTDPETGETVMLPPASGAVIEIAPGLPRDGEGEGLGSGTGGGVGSGDMAGDAPAPSNAPPPPRTTESYERSLRERQQQRAIERARQRIEQSREGEGGEGQASLLDQVRSAIDNGTLPANPSATQLQRTFGIGNTAARVLRDRLASEAPAPATAPVGEQEAGGEPAPAAPVEPAAVLAQVQQAAEAIEQEQSPPRRGTLAGGGARGSQAREPQERRDNPLSARSIIRHMADGAGGVVSGVVTATASAFEAGADLADVLDRLTGTGNPDADPAQAPGRRIGRAIRSADPFEQRTVVGDGVREVTQTIAGFLRGAQLMRTAGIMQGGSTAARVGRAAAAGVIADAIFQEADEPNIVNALVGMGVERNAVTDFLASDPEDDAALNRLRNAMTGVLTGLALDGVLAAVRGTRGALAARRAGQSSPEASVRGYHGTQADFAAMDYAQSRGFGMHFSTERATAEEFANHGGAAGRVIERDIRTGNVLDIDRDLNDWNPLRIAEWIDAAGMTASRAGADGSVGDLTRQMMRAMEAAGPLGSEQGEAAARTFLAQWLDARGYDAIRYTNRIEGEAVPTYIVWRDGPGPSAAAQPPDWWRALRAEHDADSAAFADRTEDLVRLRDRARQAGDDQRWRELNTEIERRQSAARGTPPSPAPATLAEAAGATPNELRDRIISGDEGRPLFEIAREASERATEGLDGPVVAAQLDNASQAGSRPGPNVYINWGRIRTPEDVQAVMRDMAEAFKGDVDAARRGVQTNEMTADLASRLGLTVDNLMSRQRGQAMNAEQLTAAWRLYVASTETLRRIAADAASPSAGVAEAAAFRRMMAVHHGIQSTVLGATAEAGRALQALSMVRRSGPAALRQIEDEVAASGGTDVSREMARRLNNLFEQEARGNIGPAAVSIFARNGAFARTMEAAQTYWMNAILSDPSTHFFNIIGNTSNSFLTVAERAIEARVGMTMGLPAGERAVVGEASAMAYGMTMALWDSLRLAARTYGDGGAEIAEMLGRTETPNLSGFSTRQIFGRGPADAPSRYALGIDPGTRVGRAIDFVGHNIISAPGRALGAEDAFFKSTLFRGELHALSMRRAIGNLTTQLGRQPTGAELGAEMGRLMRELPDDMVSEAAESAIYRTFNNENQLAGALQRMMQTDNPLWNFFARTIVPFPRTMTNILSYGMERSPVAPLTARFWEDYTAGGARRAAAISRMSMGSGVMLLAYQLAEQGALTGGGELERRDRGAQERQGFNPYSIRVGDTTISYNRLDPAGFILGAAGDLHHLHNTRELYGDSLEAARAAERDLTVMVSRMLEERSIFAGIASVFNSVARGSADPIVSNIVGPFVAPNIVTGIAIAQDDFVQRDAREAGERIAARLPDVVPSMPEGWQEMMRDLQERIMDIRRNTLPRRNLWGEIEVRGLRAPEGEAERTMPRGRILEDVQPMTAEQMAAAATNYLARGQVRRDRPNPIDAELVRLRLALSPVPDAMEVDGIGVNLRQFPQALDRLRVLTGNGLRMQEYGGKGLRDALVDMVEGRGPEGERYAAATDQERRRMIVGVSQVYRAAARARLLEEFPEVREHAASLLNNGAQPRVRPDNRVPGQQNRVLVLPPRTAPAAPDVEPYEPPAGLPRMR